MSYLRLKAPMRSVSTTLGGTAMRRTSGDLDLRHDFARLKSSERCYMRCGITRILFHAPVRNSTRLKLSGLENSRVRQIANCGGLQVALSTSPMDCRPDPCSFD